MKKYIFLTALSTISTGFGMKNDDHCDITGLDKGAVLQALLTNAKSYNKNEQVTPHFSQEACKKMIAKRADQYVGTVGSRAIGIHFDKNRINVRLYNTNNGKNAAQKAIAQLRPQSKL